MNRRTFIIAELGINHNGELNLAHEMIDSAARTGADAVKFQIFDTNEGIHPDCPRPGHEEANIEENITHFDLVKKWELPFEAFKELKQHAEDVGLEFVCTPYDITAARYLIDIRCKYIKLASAELTNLPMIDVVSRSEAFVILSTGMSEQHEILAAYELISSIRDGAFAFLKCTSNYPCTATGLNLNGINWMKRSLPNAKIGFSDHSNSINAAIAAVAVGATIIEKHFTLDKTMWGPDHLASADEAEMTQLVSAVREVELAMGDAKFGIQPEEVGQRRVMTKSCYWRDDMQAGSKVTFDDVKILRPSGGMSPSVFYREFNGKRLKRLVNRGDMVAGADFE